MEKKFSMKSSLRNQINKIYMQYKERYNTNNLIPLNNKMKTLIEKDSPSLTQKIDNLVCLFNIKTKISILI